MFEAKSDPDLDAVWQWFEFQGQLIAGERRRFRLSLRGNASPDSLDPLLKSRFLGLDETEVDYFFQNQRAELDLIVMLQLLATAEAILRIDFDTRVANRFRDSLSRKYRTLQRVRRNKIRLDEDLLQALKEEVSPALVVNDFRAALRLRHWLAHGRYWSPKLGRQYLPADIFDISNALAKSLAAL